MNGQPDKRASGNVSRWCRRLVWFIVLLVLGVMGFNILPRFMSGASSEVAVKQVVGGRERYCSNPQFGQSALPELRQAEFIPFSFDVEKLPQTYRIFVLGGAAARGVPDEYYSCARILDLLLANDYAGVDFEIINLGLPGIDSGVLYKIAESCKRLDPDLLIVHALDLHECSKDEMERICRAGVKSGAKVLLASRGEDVPQIEGVSSVDLARALDAAATYGVTGKELVFDNVHYRFAGNFVVARAMRDAVAGLIPDSIQDRRTGNDVMGLEVCEERLVYTDVERYLSLLRVIGMSSGAARTETADEGMLEKLREEVKALKGNVDPELRKLLPRYKLLTARYPDDWHLNMRVADYAYRFYKNPRLAADQAQRVLVYVPHPGAHVVLMRIAIAQGEFDEAEKHASVLIGMRPHRGDHYFDMGEICKLRGEYETAIKWFSKGVKFTSGNEAVVAYTYLAEMYEAIGRPEKAIRILYEAIEDDPSEHAERAYANLAALLEGQGRTDEALEVSRRAAKLQRAEQ